MQFRTTLFLLFLYANPAHSESTQAVPENLLKLGDAVALTLANNAELQVYNWDIRIAEAEALQASLRPNPALSLELEDGLGSGDYRAFDVGQSTLSLSQTIELGGKRIKRMRLASAATQLAQQDYVLKRARILSALAKAYLDALQAQQEVAFAKDLLTMQEELLTAQEDRIKAGRTAEAERETAYAAVSLAELDVREAEQQLAAAHLGLAAFWASDHPSFHEVTGSLELPTELPQMNILRKLLKENPILTYHHRLLTTHESGLELERASRLSDVNVGIGLRRFEVTDDHALTLGISISLPLFDRNQGNIRKAQAEVEKAKAARRQVLSSLTNALATAHQALQSSHSETKILATQVVPSANKGYNLMRESFRLGKASYLELRQAQATAIEARRKLYTAQIRFHKASVDIDTLIGKTN